MTKRISSGLTCRLVTALCLAISIESKIPALADVNTPAIQDVVGTTEGSQNLVVGFAFSTDVSIRITHLGKYVEWGMAPSASGWEAKIWDSNGTNVLATVNILATDTNEVVSGNKVKFHQLSSPVDLPAGSYVIGVATLGASGDKYKNSCTTLTTGAHVTWLRGRYNNTWSGSGPVPYPANLNTSGKKSYFGPNFKYLVALPLITTGTPADEYAAAGGDAVFTVTATNPLTGDANGLQYNWYRKSDPNILLTEGGKYAGTTTPSLTVKTVGAMDEGDYFCRVTIISTSAKADSRAAKLVMKRLLGHWPLDANAADTSGNGYNGTLMGSPSFMAGKVGTGALSLNGVNQYAAVPVTNIMSAISASQTVSISLWQKGWPTQASNQALVGATNGASLALQAMITMSYLNSYVYWDAGNPTDGTDQIYSVIDSNDPNAPIRQDWNYLVFTKAVATGDMKVYSNGRLWLSGTGDTKSMSGATSLSIGASAGGTTKFYQGLIDDVQIYNYPLSATEVATLYAATKCVIADLTNDCEVDFRDFSIFANSWRKIGNSLTGDFTHDNEVGLDDLFMFSEHWLEGKRLALRGDLNSDGEVTITDLYIFSMHWLDSCSALGWCDGADLNQNGNVDFTDFSLFAEEWLST
jgi:hypothetical protein